MTVGSSTGKTVVLKDLETISNSVNNARDPVQQVQICSYEPADFIMTAVIKRDSTYTWQDVKGRVVEAIKSAFSFDLRDFGQAVSLSEVISVIQSVPGVKGLIQCSVGNLSMEDTISGKDAFIPALTAREESGNIHGAQLLLVKLDSVKIEEAKND